MMDEADRLYSLPLEDFIAERDALAKTLRGEGRRDDANAVKALRKPTATVWAVNQVMRTQRKAARSLLEAADRAAAKPGDREALGAHRAALEELTTAAGGLLSAKGRGLSEDGLLRVRDALHAGSLDRELRDDFAAGRLTSEPSPAGFAAITGTPEPRTPTRPAPRPQPRPSAAARKRVERAEARVAKAGAKLKEAEAEARHARSLAERTGAKEDAARGRLDEAERELADARAKLGGQG
jgi:hypothetical protein